MNTIKKDYAWHIVDKRKTIEKIFGLIILVCLIMIPMVPINYDLTAYLPDTTETGRGLDLMKEEFGFPGTAQLMLEDVTIYEAKAYKDQIETVEGVDSVMWTDTFGYVFQSESFIDYDAIDDYYKDGNALMNITFIGEDAEEETGDAVGAINAIVGDKGHMIGQAVANKSLQETVFSEVAGMMIVVVPLILLILFLTTTSWLEPVLFIIVMGIAVIINKGTDLFIGEISFLTFAISALLQLAVATDYAIFLFHAFARHKEDGHPADEAMVLAIRESTKSIMGSSMTTVVGFLALTLMEFTIGYDMGLSMAKGVLACMLSVIVLMPSMVLRSYKWIERFSHHSFFPSFDRSSKALYRSRRVTLVAILVLLLPMVVAKSITPYSFGMDDVASAEGTKYHADEQLIKETFGSKSMLAIIAPKSDLPTEQTLVDDLDALPYVTDIISLAGMIPEGVPVSALPESLVEQLHSEEYMRILVYIASGKSEGEAVYNAFDELEATVRGHYPDDAYIVGGIASTKEIEEILVTDYPHINRLSILGVYLVMALTFRSLLMPLLALVPIESAITFNMAIPYFSGMKLMYLGMVMVSCILLGATVDYSILLCHTYLDLRKEMDKKEAAIAAIKKCIPTVITSASIMAIVGYIVSLLTSLQILIDLGMLISRGAVLGMLFVMILLPALLTLFDGALQKEQAFFDQRRHKRAKILEPIFANSSKGDK